MRRAWTVCASLVCVVVFASSPGSAQVRRTTNGVLAPPAPIAAPDGVLALELNPSALALLEAWGLLYVHTELPSHATNRDEGDALHAASPLFFGLAAGASVQSVRPGNDESDRGVVTLGLGYAASPTFALGGAVRWLGSEDARISGITTLDLSATWRPSPLFSFALVGRDLNGPMDLAGSPEGIDIPASFVFATALRPFGTRRMTLEGAFGIDTDDRLGARGVLELTLPWMGRLQAALEAEDLGSSDPDLRLTSGVAIDWGAIGVSGGVVVPHEDADTLGWYAAARLEGMQREGLPVGRHVVDLEVAGGLGSREIIRLVAQLDQALHDGQVAGVLLRLRSTGVGLAYAQELRMSIEALVRSRKPVVCHLDAATGSEYYACGTASKTLIDPAGGIRLMGPTVEVLLIGELLERLGLHADFLRIGEYKSAPEQFTNRTSTEPARESRAQLLDDVTNRLVADLARDLHVTRQRVNAVIDDGPYVAEEALALSLVDDQADELVLEEALDSAFDRRYPLREGPSSVAKRRWGSPPTIGVVVVDGHIVDGENLDIPFLDLHFTGGRTVARSIEQFANDPRIAAIIVRIDSPGGSVLASDQMWRALMRARARKPVIASMGEIAASGGYYVASAADEIWADPATLTGSIGVFFGKVDAETLASRIGISVEQLRRHRRAGVESIWRPFTGDERAMLADKLQIWYRMFLRRIAEGRGMRIEAIDAVGRGRAWSGDSALSLGLIDHLGGFGSALVRARQLADLDSDAEAVVLPFRPVTLLDYVTGGASAADVTSTPQGARAALPLSADLRHAATLGTLLANVRSGMPLALSPTIIRVE